VGEPVSRTLTLQAKGLAGSQLPVLKLAQSSALRIYPDQDEHETRTDGNTVYGILKQKFTYIPKAEGKQSLPAITIDWWDVNTKQQQKLSLATKDIQVLPGVAGSNPVTTQPAQANASADLKNPLATTMANTPDQLTNTQSTAKGSILKPVLWWLIGLALLLAGVAYAFYKGMFPYSKKQGANEEGSQPSKILTPKAYTLRKNKKEWLQQLHTACVTGHAQDAAKYLIQLAKMEWRQEPQLNLGSIAKRVSKGADAILQLDQYLYADHAVDLSKSWDGKPLWQALNQGLTPKNPSAQRKQTGIDDLYPQVI
jgi:hypothetical protein